MARVQSTRIQDEKVEGSISIVGDDHPDGQPDRNSGTRGQTVAIFCGRGRIGKTSFLRGCASLALLAGREVRLCDFDRSNSSLTKYYSEAKMLETAAQLPMERKIQEVFLEFLKGKSSYAFDVAGNDKVFENFFKQGDVSRLLERYDKWITWLQVFSTDEEDVSYFRTAFDALGSQSRIRWVVCLSYATALEGDEEEQFAAVRHHPVITRVLEAGGEIIGIPRLAINDDVVNLRLRYEDAIANRPGPEGSTIGEWNALRVEAWLDALRQATTPVTAWLP